MKVWRSILLASFGAAVLAVAAAPAEAAGQGNGKSKNGGGARSAAHSVSKNHATARKNHGAQVRQAAQSLRDREHPAISDGIKGRHENHPDATLSQVIDAAHKFRED